jgi:hypothetical protein
MAVRASLASERQKRLLRGDTTAITSLSCTSGGCPATPTNAFDHFSADSNGNYTSVVNYPIEKCSSTTQRACWDVGSSGGKRTYTFRFVESSDGEAKFILDNNRLSCNDSAPADCKMITR